MYCGRCGATDNGVITQKLEQDGNTITVSCFSMCKRCGEPLGIKELFTLTDWDYIDPRVIRQTLENCKEHEKLG